VQGSSPIVWVGSVDVRVVREEQGANIERAPFHVHFLILVVERFAPVQGGGVIDDFLRRCQIQRRLPFRIFGVDGCPILEKQGANIYCAMSRCLVQGSSPIVWVGSVDVRVVREEQGANIDRAPVHVHFLILVVED